MMTTRAQARAWARRPGMSSGNGRARWGLLAAVPLAAGLLLSGADASSAQESVGCLRGRPLPACKTFWIVEMQGSTPLAQTSRTVVYGGDIQEGSDAFDQVLEWNLGHMVNLSPTFAVGGELTLGTGNTDVLTGMRLRARRWLGKDLSVELEGGLLRTDAGQSRYPGVYGGTVDVRFNIRDQGSFYVRWDALDLEEQSFDWMFDPGGFHHALSLGASAGSVPALVGTGALGLAWTILFAIYWQED